MSAILTTFQQRRFNMAQVKVALRLYLNTGMLPHYRVTLTKLLAQATQYTKRTYPRSRKGCELAMADLVSKMLEEEPK